MQQIIGYAIAGLLALEGIALLIVSPLLLIPGGWGGADYGGIWYGIGNVLGLPRLLFAVCAFLSLRWLRRHQENPARISSTL